MKNSDLYIEAMEQFHQIYESANTHCDPRAMSLATVSSQGIPRVRTITVKLTNEQNLLFFTNTVSRTGLDLAANKYAALCVYWEQLQRQVVVEGKAMMLDDRVSDQYWAATSRDYQLACWSSCQSTVVENPTALNEQLKTQRRLHRDQLIPRHVNWAGYFLIPDRIEFWRSGWKTLNEKVCYEQLQSEPRKILINP